METAFEVNERTNEKEKNTKIKNGNKANGKKNLLDECELGRLKKETCKLHIFAPEKWERSRREKKAARGKAQKRQASESTTTRRQKLNRFGEQREQRRRRGRKKQSSLFHLRHSLVGSNASAIQRERANEPSHSLAFPASSNCVRLTSAVTLHTASLPVCERKRPSARAAVCERGYF